MRHWFEDVADHLGAAYLRYSFTKGTEQEVAFLQQRIGQSRTLEQLLDLRRHYAPSFAFVVRCLPTLVRLHAHTALDNSFPRDIRPSRQDSLSPEP